MIGKFLRTHWLGFVGLAGVLVLMCCDVMFSTESTKVDADGPYVMTRMFGTRDGDLLYTVVGRQWDQEIQWVLHAPKLGSLWIDRRTEPGEWNARVPLWMLLGLTLAGMAIASTWPTAKPAAQPEPAPVAPANEEAKSNAEAPPEKKGAAD